jgi:uncharacterized protein (TIGR03067 family)
MRRRTPLVVVLLGLAAAAVRAGDEPSGGGDLAKLQGTWTTKAGPKKSIPVTLEIKDDKAVVALKTPQGLKIRAEGRVRLDPDARPRALDWVEFTAPDGEEMPQIAAIYELDGDTFRVCCGGPNAARPSKFEPGDGPLADVVVFRRAAAAKQH